MLQVMSRNTQIILWVSVAVIVMVVAFLYVTAPPKWTEGKG